MDFQSVLNYLIDLRFNNNRQWFKANEERYHAAREQYIQLLEAVLDRMKQTDSSLAGLQVKDCMFRIFRDVRFSQNKEPYKTNFGAFLAKGGRKSQLAGYYLHFEPDGSFIGGGIYMPAPPVLQAIRTGIFMDPDSYRQIIKNKQFSKYFPKLYGEKLKTAPKGFPKDFPDVDLLKNKHYAVGYEVDNDFWLQENVVDKVVEVFEAQYPFNYFLNRLVEPVV